MSTTQASTARGLLDMLVSERDFAQLVVDFAQLRGWRVYRTWNSRHSPEGFPDLVAVRAGRLVVAELKTTRGKLSAAQQDWANALAQTTGCEYFTWRPSDWDEIEETLK